MSSPTNYLQPSHSAFSNAATRRLGIRIGLAVVSVLAAAFLLAYIAIATSRLSYPFELEWMEGGSVLHVQLVLD